MPNISQRFKTGYGQGGYGEGFYGGWQGPGVYPPDEYYYSLITSQYQNSPKFMALVQSMMKYLNDALPFVLTIYQNFDLSLAVGKQLDVVGTYLGVSRTVGFQPTGGGSPVLDDDTYRILLQAKQIQNNWDGRISSLQQWWQKMFPGGQITIIDNQNMSVTVIVSGAFTSIIKDLILNGYIVPRPQGVLLNIALGATPFLGFDYNNTFVSGFDNGKFI